MIFVSERDGYAHLYRKDRKGHLQALTQGPWQVTAFYGVDPKTSTAYFQSTSQGPENRDICAVNLRNGRIRRLSSGNRHALGLFLARICLLHRCLQQYHHPRRSTP